MVRSKFLFENYHVWVYCLVLQMDNLISSSWNKFMDKDSSALFLCPYQNGRVVQTERGGEGKKRNELSKYDIQNDPSTRQRPSNDDQDLGNSKNSFPITVSKGTNPEFPFFRLQGHRTPSQKWFSSLSYQFVVLCHCSPCKLVYPQANQVMCTVKFENFLPTLLYALQSFIIVYQKIFHSVSINPE